MPLDFQKLAADLELLSARVGEFYAPLGGGEPTKEDIVKARNSFALEEINAMIDGLLSTVRAEVPVAEYTVVHEEKIRAASQEEAEAIFRKRLGLAEAAKG